MKQKPLDEKWTQWKPMEGLSPKYFVDSIVDNLKEFSILLSDENDKKKHVKMTFETVILSHRHTDESQRIKTIHYLDEKYGGSFYSKWTFFKVENSKYVSWIVEETSGFGIPEPIIHYALIDSNSIVDIVTHGDPIIEIL